MTVSTRKVSEWASDHAIRIGMSGMLFYVRSLKCALCADVLRRFLSIASSIYSEFICKVSLSDCFFETHFGICAGSPSAELHICDLNHYMMLLLVAEAQ